MNSAAKATVMRSIDIQSTQDSVVKAIQSAIFSGELKMGQRIMEEELAETFQISRATVREALRRLEQVGLVQIKPRRGTFVTRLTLKEVERTCRLRAALEGLAAQIRERTSDGQRMGGREADRRRDESGGCGRRAECVSCTWIANFMN